MFIGPFHKPVEFGLLLHTLFSFLNSLFPWGVLLVSFCWTIYIKLKVLKVLISTASILLLPSSSDVCFSVLYFNHWFRYFIKVCFRVLISATHTFLLSLVPVAHVSLPCFGTYLIHILYNFKYVLLDIILPVCKLYLILF
jgi:hypothetical protein